MKTIYDSEADYQIERNALAGSSFGKTFKDIVCRKLSPRIYEAIVARIGKGEGIKTAAIMKGLPELEAIDVVQISDYSSSVVKERLLEYLDCPLVKKLSLIADAITERSALHAALVLAAITARTGFGLKEPLEREKFSLDKKKYDALCLEGSLWKISSYKEKVYDL